MMGEFGPRLRQERERRKISLESISVNTKVSIALFEGLERDDLSRWPTGIFRRSFVRAYATAIGLDPEATVSEFLDKFPEPDLPAEDVVERAGSRTAVRSQATPAVRLTVADGRWFRRGQILPAAGRRCAAVAIDATVILAFGLIFRIALDAYLVATLGFIVGYYWGGILILGNTPGVCLEAPQQPQRVCALQDSVSHTTST